MFWCAECPGLSLTAEPDQDVLKGRCLCDSGLFLCCDKVSAAGMDATINHQVVTQVEFFDFEAVAVTELTLWLLSPVSKQSVKAGVIEFRVISVAVDGFTQAAGKANLLDGADVGTGATKRREVGDHQIADPDQLFIFMADQEPGC